MNHDGIVGPTLTRISTSEAVNESPVSKSVTKFSYDIDGSFSTAERRMDPDLRKQCDMSTQVKTCKHRNLMAYTRLDNFACNTSSV